MTGFFVAIWSQFSAWIGLAGVGVVMAAIAFFKGKADGKRSAELEQMKAREKLHDAYDEIDGHAIDPGAAYGNLRERLRNDGDR